MTTAREIIFTAAALLAVAGIVWLIDWPAVIDSAFPSTRLTLEDGVRIIEERVR